jgi:hypothetical protein
VEAVSEKPSPILNDEEFVRRVGELGRFMQDAAKAIGEAWTPIIRQRTAALKQAVDAIDKDLKPDLMRSVGRHAQICLTFGSK